MSLMCPEENCKATPGACKHEKIMASVAAVVVALLVIVGTRLLIAP